jgi:phage terminase large subunit-like protein
MHSLQTENLTRTEQVELISLLEERSRRAAEVAYITTYNTFYDWQREFVAATKDHHECCLCAANQIGKTYLGTTIDAMHLMGDYPEDWEGHVFENAPLCWGLGFSMEKTRDLIQKTLFGEYSSGTGFEGGLVPKSRIVSWESATGTPNAMRTVRVKHSNGVSVIQFWSYSQGQHAIMGDVVDWFHIDEEPRDQTIRPQVLTRTINGDKGRGGRGIYTFTPENGRTDLVIQFMDAPSSAQFFMKKGWADAPHMTKEKKERLLAQYPEHQRKMRTEGEPMLGHGRIYDIGDEFIICDPFEIPKHWKVINGMDFGYDHPQAHVQIAINPDDGSVYVTKAWKATKVSANDAWGAVKQWSTGIPCAWPHDGLQHEKGRDDAVQQKKHYEDAGFKMLFSMATWPEYTDEKGNQRSGGNSVEQGIFEIRDLMRKGKFKVFSGLGEVLEEIRQYHRSENSKIVKVRDDLLDAIRYAYMMQRYAIYYGDAGAVKPAVKLPPTNRPMRLR